MNSKGKFTYVNYYNEAFHEIILAYGMVYAVGSECSMLIPTWEHFMLASE